MAKMFEALERAQQERQKRSQGQSDPQSPPPAEGEAPPSDDAAAPAPARVPIPSQAQIPHPEIAPQIVGAHDSHSPVTEQIRQIRTNLESILADYRSRAIVVSSPVSGDGKTLVSANLATVRAVDPANRVLIVDADMRGPQVHRLFGVRQTPGLADYLRNACSLEEALKGTSFPNLTLLPAGNVPARPPVLLGSDRMLSLMSELQRHYNWIIFDTPPLLPVTDASVLARACTGLILVVRMGRTHRSNITRAQDLLAEMRLPVLGCILNDYLSPERKDEYYYKYYKTAGKNGS